MADSVNKLCCNRNISTKFEMRKCDKNTKDRKKKKKPRKPVVEVSRRKDRTIINEFHTLNKKIEAVQKNPSMPNEDKASKIAVLEAKQEKLGGLNAYQHASKLGEVRHGSFNSSKWVIKQLKAFNVRPPTQKLKPNATDGPSEKLNLLDVGALQNNYQKHVKWIQCTPIDLNPQSSEVQKADLLTIDAREKYDVVVMSLVINFEGDLRKRGDMLRKCQQLIVDQGHLFFVIPLPCLKNSRYLNEVLFVSMMNSLGFDVCVSHKSKKLSFFMFRKTRQCQVKSFPKQVLRKGGNRNNFAIVL